MDETAAIIVAVLLGAIAVAQVALVAGAPWGAHFYGGRVETRDGVLPAGYRLMSAGAVIILGLMVWIVLAYSGTVGAGLWSGGFLDIGIWVVFGYLVLNTLGNLSGVSPIERWLMSTVTALCAALVLLVAL